MAERLYPGDDLVLLGVIIDPLVLLGVFTESCVCMSSANVVRLGPGVFVRFGGRSASEVEVTIASTSISIWGLRATSATEVVHAAEATKGIEGNVSAAAFRSHG